MRVQPWWDDACKRAEKTDIAVLPLQTFDHASYAYRVCLSDGRTQRICLPLEHWDFWEGNIT